MKLIEVLEYTGVHLLVILLCGSTFATARLLRLRVRMPLEAWISVSYECCVLSRSGPSVGLVTRSEESYRGGCVLRVISKPQQWRGLGLRRAVEPRKKKHKFEWNILSGWVEIVRDYVSWIYVAYVMGQWLFVVNTVMNPRVSWIPRNFWSNWIHGSLKKDSVPWI